MGNVSVSDAEYDRLRSLVEFPEAWMPNPGDTLVGEAVRWETVTTRSDATAEVLTVRTNEGVERSVWCWHAQLRYGLIADKGDVDAVIRDGGERKCRVGDLVAIHYRGKSAMDDGNEAASYRIAIERPETTEIPF